MRAIRVLVVDDSAFVRKAVREMLEADAGIEVVGAARDGEDALVMAEELAPDVVACDLHMPRLDGIGFVRAQMARRPIPIVILSKEAADTALTVATLEAGAVEFVRKPTLHADDRLREVATDLIDRVRIAAGARVAHSRALPQTPAIKSSPAHRRADIVVLGVSTGGPQALSALLQRLPRCLPVPLVIVIHMPAGYIESLASRLDRQGTLPVEEARAGVPIQAGMAYVAPAGRHLTFRRSIDGSVIPHFSLAPLDAVHRPAVDELFRSAAVVYGARVLAVVMTGMGTDGAAGAGAVCAAGGTVLTESESTCVVYGMPRAVVERGFSSRAVPLAGMAEAILREL